MNPFRDDPIINARKAVRDALAALTAKPGPHAALALQRAQRTWQAAKRLAAI